ncbi:MAG: accessory gene regulator B family protein [Defluviitaleaceae bacterium]|nr:accessory gene regulator B family protein [Defluviitaleaceae bacterium]
MFMKNVAVKITDRLERQGIFEPTDREIYLFGTQLGLNLLLHLMTMTLVGLMIGSFWHIVIFLLAYMPLRSFSGGYHAKTQLKCYIISTIMIAFVGLASRFITFNSILLGVLLLMFGIVIMLISPIGNKNKSLDDLEIKVYGRKARFICIVELSVAIITLLIGMQFITTGIFWAFSMVLLLLVLEKLFGSKI